MTDEAQKAGAQRAAAPDPVATAQRLSAPLRPKKFYTRADAVAEGGAFALKLDGRRAMTPGRRPVAVAQRAIAEAIAAEWAGQGEFIVPATMPLTRLANSAIDGVTERLAEVRADIAAYAGSDLVVYRAGEPDGLVAKQKAGWDPVVRWAEARFGARIILAEGVMHVAQSDALLAGVAAALESETDPLRLAAISLSTSISGSALIALALAAGVLDADAAWAAAHVDEDWNVSQWGEDAEAAERQRKRRLDFGAASFVLAQL